MLRRMLGRGPAERVRMDPKSPWWGEHRSRYHFAAQHVTGKRVLDVACGTGYGARILRDAGAAEVLGVDYSSTAIDSAIEHVRDGIFLSLGDAHALPIGDSLFDVAASFETIEHLEQAEIFVQEIARSLVDGGIALISNPNGRYSKVIHGRLANPFHVHEYRPEELLALLRPHFQEVRLYGQRTDPRFGMSPFWDPKELRDSGILTMWKLLIWRIAHRLPFGIKDRVTRLIKNRPFYPGEFDFVFCEDESVAHVLVAVCIK